MPTMNQVAPPEWIKATQFAEGENRTLTISGWTTDVFTDQNTGVKKTSVAFLFNETPSKFGIVNNANKDSLDSLFGVGYDLDALAGKQITLFRILVKQEKNGDPVYGLRIKANQRTAQLAPASTKAEQLSQLGEIRKLIHDASGTMPAKDTLVWSTEAEFAEILAVHKALLETALSESMP